MEFKDYYKILGVDKKATPAEIKSAYRRLAKKYHPDTNSGNKDSETKIKDINEAYEVLADAEKRGKYDKMGSSWNDFRQTGGQADDFNWNEWSARRARNTKHRENFFTNIGDMFSQGGGFSDFFEKFFHGEEAAQKAAYTKTPSIAEDTNASVEITLEEAYSGTTKQIVVNNQKIDISLKPGIVDGTNLKISGRKTPDRRGNAGGDVYIKIIIKPHKKVERKGDDLYVEVPIDLYMAILGGSTKIKTFAGTVSLNIPPETQPGKVLKLKSLGMPNYVNPNQRGDLYITLSIKLPKKPYDG